MCIIVESPKPLIAEEDIVCYKLVRKYFGDVYTTLYRNCPINLSEEFHAVGKLDLDYEYTWYHDKKLCDGYAISKGVIHAYALYECAKKVADSMNISIFKALLDTSIKEIIILKGIIPKGTDYYINYDKSEIAAKKMIFEKL